MANGSSPNVDVVILTWNDADQLVEAVDSVLGATDVQPKVIVVDNGSDPAAPIIEDERVEWHRVEENLGVAGGRNIGLAASTAAYVCLLDSDATAEPQMLQALIQPMRTDNEIAMTCPVFSGQAAEIGAGRAPSFGRKVKRALRLTDTYAPMPRPADAPRWDVEFAIGACQMIRRAVLDEVGDLDDTHLFGPEDLEFCERLTKAGHRIVQVQAAVCHHKARRSHRRLLSARGRAHLWAVLRHYARRARAS